MLFPAEPICFQSNGHGVSKCHLPGLPVLQASYNRKDGAVGVAQGGWERGSFKSL